MAIINNSFYRVIYLLIIIIILLFFSYYARDFKLDASSDTLILQNDKDFKYFNYYNDIFPTKNFLVLAIKSNSIIDDLYLKKINEIKSILSNIKNIDSTFAIVDAPILISNNLTLADLSSTKITTINDNIFDLELALNEFSNSPIFKDQLISKDKKVSSIIIYLKKNNKFLKIKKKREDIINTNINENNFKEVNKTYKLEKEKYNKERHELIDNIRTSLDQANIPYQYFLGGIDMIADDTINFIKKDILIFSITVSVFLIIILFLIYRDFKWVLIPLVTTFYSIVVMMGINGFLNWEITAISANFISLMLILSISMNIHIINQYRISTIKNLSSNNLNETLKNMFFPCFYTALTTIVAFGSLIFSDIKPVIDFGKIMIVALLIIFITSFTILPLLISFFPKINTKQNINIKNILLFIQSFFYHKIKIIIINILLFIFSIIGILNLNVENSFINYFKKDTEIFKGMKLIDQDLGGTTPLDIIIKFHDEDNLAINNNANYEDELDFELDLGEDLITESNKSSLWFTEEKLILIKDIHNYLENQKEIGKVQSIYSLIKVAEQINKKPLSSFELAILYEKIPENYKVDLILPYLSIDKNMIKINARVKDSDIIKRGDLINNITNHLSNKYELIEEVKVNGLLVLYNNMLQSLFSSQIKSFALVLILIFIMFLILFHSLKLSIVGIIPNILASSFILGLIGILGIPLDIMTITIAAITIGIAVDNTIHYLYRFRKNLSLKISVIESLKNSHNSVGQAVLTTSITIAFGFSVLSLSNFVPTILFGLFTSLAMIIAMLGVLVSLPILMQYFYNKV